MLNSFPKWLHHIYGYYQCTHVQMLHVLKNILHCLSFHFNHSAEYVAVSFVTNDTEHLFMCLLAIHIFIFPETPAQIYYPVFFVYFFFCFLAKPAACGSSWARDQTRAIPATRATAVTTLILSSLHYQGTPSTFFFFFFFAF